MNSYFSRLSPIERRFAVGVMGVVFLVLNVVFVWPRFSDWGQTKSRLATAQDKLRKYQFEFAQTNSYAAQIKTMEREGAAVPEEEQGMDFLQIVQDQSAQSDVDLRGTLRPSTLTNQFFIELVRSFTVLAGEEQLVDFLYGLSAGNSMIRVRDLIIHPELPQRQQLNVTVKLVASYQKKPAASPAPSTSIPVAAQPAKSTQ